MARRKKGKRRGEVKVMLKTEVRKGNGRSREKEKRGVCSRVIQYRRRKKKRRETRANEGEEGLFRLVGFSGRSLGFRSSLR